MNKKLSMVLGVVWLVGCGGSGEPWHGGEPPDIVGPPHGRAGSWPGGGATAAGSGTGGSELIVGGEPTGGYGFAGSIAEGGHEAGGVSYGGSLAVGGDEAVGGEEAEGGAGGYVMGGFGGTGTGGGYPTGGTNAGGLTCSQNVAHCFDAAANCYEYSPWSDCDQIVDVCAAMQLECSE